MSDSAEASHLVFNHQMYETASRGLANDKTVCPAIIKLSKTLMSSSYFDVRLSDKDGCCVLIPKHNLVSGLLAQIRSSSSYRSHVVHDDFAVRMSSGYVKCVNDLLLRETDVLSDESLVSLKSALYKVWRVKGHGGLIARIDATIKTHKPQGEVEPRLLHTSKYHPFKPLLKYYAEQLKFSLRQFPFLLRDTPDFLQKLPLRSIFSCNARWIQIDIKDYFLSGNHEDLIQYSSMHCSVTHRREFRNCFELVLSNQIVSVKADNDSLLHFQCIRGSGMGLTSSGEVSDCAFLQMVEVPLICSSLLAREHGLRGYWRFKDDIICLIDVPNPDHHAREIFRKMKERSKEFKLKQVAVARQVDFLDVTVFFDEVGQIKHDVFIKGSKLGRPLCSSSMHHPSVHSSWPRAEVVRLRSRCSTYSLGNAAVQMFKRKIFHESFAHISLRPTRGSRIVVAEQTDSIDHFRIVIPFHPAFVSLGPACKKHGLKVCWRNGGTCMLRLFRGLKSQVASDESSTWLYGAASAEEEVALFFVSNKNSCQRTTNNRNRP